ncbi:MAG TPA: sulfite reductase subunit beta [Syntrophobacteraceae bacterium]|nr:sulfite reductase subunit beta [Syntrophobacteraceae bacterium]
MVNYQTKNFGRKDMENRADAEALRKLGMIEQRQEGLFALRVHGVAGDFTPEQLRKIADVAQKYGKGLIHLTGRQGAEIHSVPRMYLESATKEIESLGMASGASGPFVHVTASCPGNATCKRGVIETKEITRRLDEKYFRLDMPHRFRMSVTGCPNNCARATENEIGVMGAIEPRWQKSECYNCGACVYACPVGAITVTDGQYVVDRARCTNCGTCASSCPNAAWTAAKRGYVLWAGGMMGKVPRLATKLPVLFASKDALFDAINRVIEYYRAYGKRGERLGDMMERVGTESFLAQVMGDEGDPTISSG